MVIDMYGVFTNRGDGYTYGYTQFEFATADINSLAVQQRLVDQLQLTPNEVLELLTSYHSSIDFEQDRYDRLGNGFQSVYIEKMDVV